MAILRDFIVTVGLDHTFFYQFILVAGLYFITKKLFLLDYYKQVEKRQESTKGSFSQSQAMESKLEELKIVYTQKAQRLNKNFQEVFAQIKLKADQDFLQKRDAIQNQFRKKLEEQKQLLIKNKMQEDEKLETSLPALVETFINKMRGKA